MSVKTDGGGAVSLALGDLLTAEDPVWVWDVQARRILWANRTGLAFWGADTVDALRGRRFHPRDKSLARIAALAAEAGIEAREWTETLTFPSRGARMPATCYIQSMEVAGGRPGLILRALDAPAAAQPPPPQPPLPGDDDEASGEAAGDKAALQAIAGQLKAAKAARARKSRRASGQAPPAPLTDSAASQMHAAFVRELCHELRNPLTVIIGFAERIRDTDRARDGAKAKGYAQNILEGANLALEILRNFSGRLHEEEGHRPPQPADVKAAVESCLRLVAPLAKQSGLAIGKSLGRRLPLLNTEERALKQILLNLLLNAVRHQKTGGRVSVDARRRRDGALMITVSDDGIGMTKKEIKAALGGKKSGGKKSNSKRSGGGKPDMNPAAPVGIAGSGLGLPLVKRLVEAAGGAITIESPRRKGTSVEIRFPPASLTPLPAPSPAPAPELA